MPKKFICSDESINCYGFRVLTTGIKLDSFKKNPVGFLNHNTGGSFWGTDPNYSGPIIRWDDISKEEDSLIATPVFDLNDDLGKKVHDKVESDFIRAASIGFRIIETSEDPSLMLPGQIHPTVTKCELIEISVVDLPANKNALALFDVDNNRIELDDSTISITLSASLKKQTIPLLNNTMKLKIEKAWTGLLSLLGIEVPEGSNHVETEVSAEKLADINNKVNELSALQESLLAKDADIATLNLSLTTAQTSLTNAQAEIETLKAEIAELRKPAESPSHPVKTKDENADPDEKQQELSDEQKRAELLNFDVKKVSLSENPFFAQ